MADHLLRMGKTLRMEGEALVVGLPRGVNQFHRSWQPETPSFVHVLQRRLLRFLHPVARFPGAENPRGRQAGTSGKRGVARQDLLGRGAGDQPQRHRGRVASDRDDGRLVRGGEPEQRAGAGVDEQAVPRAGDVERHRLVGQAARCAVHHQEINDLAALVDVVEALAQAEEMLVGPGVQIGGQPARARLCGRLDLQPEIVALLRRQRRVTASAPSSRSRTACSDQAPAPSTATLPAAASDRLGRASEGRSGARPGAPGPAQSAHANGSVVAEKVQPSAFEKPAICVVDICSIPVSRRPNCAPA